MKIVNPIGRKPVGKEDLKAYRACYCSDQSATTYGYDACTRCACQCSNGNVNNAANRELANVANY